MSAIVVQADMDDVLDASPVESARNTGLDGEMFEPVEEMKDESSRHPDRGGMKEYMYEDGDSAIDIVNQMDEEDESARSSTAFKAQLQRLELENIELKKKLALVNNQV